MTDQSFAVGPGERDVRLRLRAVATIVNAPLTGNHIGVSGIVEAIGPAEHKYKIGDEVLAYVPATRDPHSSHELVHRSNLCPKPTGITFEDGASLPVPFVAAVHVLSRLGINVPFGSEVEHMFSGVLVLGGEKASASALLQLLHQAMPSAAILVACKAAENDDEEAVRPYCHQAILSGAKYAIDAKAEDLVSHLRSAVEVYTGSKELQLIIDVGGEAVQRPELLELLGNEGRYIPSYQERSEVDVAQEPAMTRLELLLKDMKVQVPFSIDQVVVKI